MSPVSPLLLLFLQPICLHYTISQNPGSLDWISETLRHEASGRGEKGFRLTEKGEISPALKQKPELSQNNPLNISKADPMKPSLGVQCWLESKKGISIFFTRS